MKRTLATLGKGKTTVLAVAVALVLVVAPAALAANGKPLILGKGDNVATKVTGLIGHVASGPALLIKNSRGGPALDLRVKSGTSPIEVNSATRVANLNADHLDGQDSSAFVRNNIYRAESTIDAGTALGDGTFVKGHFCNPGDVLLSGGPANVNATSDMVESFPAEGSRESWTVKINKNGQTDNFSVAVLCADQ